MSSSSRMLKGMVDHRRSTWIVPYIGDCREKHGSIFNGRGSGSAIANVSQAERVISAALFFSAARLTVPPHNSLKTLMWELSQLINAHTLVSFKCCCIKVFRSSCKLHSLHHTNSRRSSNSRNSQCSLPECTQRSAQMQRTVQSAYKENLICKLHGLLKPYFSQFLGLLLEQKGRNEISRKIGNNVVYIFPRRHHRQKHGVYGIERKLQEILICSKFNNQNLM